MAFLRKSGEDIEDNDSLISSEGQRDHLRRGYLFTDTESVDSWPLFQPKFMSIRILTKYFLGE